MAGFKSIYLETLALPTGQVDANLKAALDRAYALRDFEIEHYWKRATYFWAFQVAVFAAFGFVWRSTGGELRGVALALAGLGIITGVASALSAQGSRFWQANWERHVDMLEGAVEGNLHKMVWLNGEHVSFSVSRLNTALSFWIIVFWMMLFGLYAWTLWWNEPWPALTVEQSLLWTRVCVGGGGLIVVGAVLQLLWRVSHFEGRVRSARMPDWIAFERTGLPPRKLRGLPGNRVTTAQGDAFILRSAPGPAEPSPTPPAVPVAPG